MELTKENVCVFIENEAQYEEALQLLKKYNEPLGDEKAMDFKHGIYPYLKMYDRKSWFLSSRDYFEAKITLAELETILKQQK